MGVGCGLLALINEAEQREGGLLLLELALVFPLKRKG